MKITKQPRHLIILLALLCLLGWSKGAYADVYWDVSSGNNANTGADASQPVKDWSTVLNRLASQILSGDDPWVVMMSKATINSDWTMDGTIMSGDQVLGYARVKRHVGFTLAMFYVSANKSFTIQNVTIYGSFAGADPHYATTRAIIELLSGSLTINSGTELRDNWNNTTYGGAVYANVPVTVTMNGGLIADCKGHTGGAIGLTSGSEGTETSTFTMNGGVIDNCSSISGDMMGGGIYIRGKKIGDAVYNATLDLLGGEIRNCHGGKGAGVYAYRTTAQLDGTVISGNICTGSGGGAHLEETRIELYQGIISNNEAGDNGGGINITNGSYLHAAHNQNVLVEGNRSGGYGGGYCISDDTEALVVSSKFYNNVAALDGGAIYFSSNTNTRQFGIGECDIRFNQAGRNGGGIYFITGRTHLVVGYGPLTVCDNTANSVPNNIQLPSSKYLRFGGEVTASNRFIPVNVGVYMEDTSSSDVVLSRNNDDQKVLVSDLYESIANGTNNLFDDKQCYSPIYSNTDFHIHFTNSIPWSYRQRQITTDDYKYEISNVEELTAFLCHVNGITPNATSFGSGDPTANGKLVADIDMSGQYWEPISASYTGTFDGNGHTISNLSMVPTNAGTGRGLFGTNTSGTIKNVILKDCYFGASSGYVGTIVCQNESSGKISNCVAEGDLAATGTGVVMGGVAGTNGGTIHSCYAAPDMTGYQMGGLVGSNSGSVLNSFVNAKFTPKTGNTAYMGGLVADNTGTVENGYVQLQGNAPASYFGWLVGNNTGGTVNYGYIPDGQSIYKAAGNDPSGHGTYSATLLPVRYNHTNDNQVTFVSGGETKQLLATLNNWVNQDASHKSTYTPWLRPWQKDNDSKFINDDLPLLRLPATNAVAATSGDPYLDYGQVNDLLTAYNTADDAVLFYGAESNMNGNAGSEASLYIDQEATLKQSGSKGAITARTSQMLQTYAAERWHHFSSPLKESQIGFTYNNTDPVPFNWNSNPCSVTINSNDDYSLFPSDLLTATSFNSVDLFCFYEPEYHWLNLKRATDSHWHMNAHDVKINYRGNGIEPIDPSDPNDPSNGNETYLVPGKGYLVSVEVDQLVQNYGILNDGGVTLYSVTKSDYNAWAERLGFNLLGNPYQSYLDFEEFKAVNGSNLWASDADIYEYTYAVFDPELNAYRQYKDGSSVFSNAASQYIHPHQGFFIRMTKGTDPVNRTTVTYTDDMRVVTLPENVTSPYRGATQPAFPLINLVVRDSEGNGDVAVLELDRANDEGAEKIRMSECKGLLSLGYEGRDYGILFRTEIEDYQPLRFEALEEGTFTLEWNTANGQFSELTLIDNIVGTTTDMLSRDSYSFEGNPGQYASRFKIVIGDYKDIDEFEEDGPSTGSGTFAFVMGDELVVNGEGTLSLYDVTGRLLMQTSLHGSQTNIALPDVSAGVYVLQLVSDHNGKKTQKIILE